ncbi:MAG: hypothetical protein F6K23_37130 [Okeania sp. SIO2C9]|uniref:phosphoribosyltransferase-like protein n=1 Tax=Okeania sp. SIO2C9 TaxID=2607791 RepID=UPI0013C0190E|nr:hypothetical protein [Okeania sp. SIO2C9]NEQ78126.1 hypothetical protein [Okeania sp. SIO2C9]
MNDYQHLLQSIAKTIEDYRQGEIAPMTSDHVDRWVCQFEESDRLTILREMEQILKKYYVSRQTAKNIITRALTSNKIFGFNPGQVVLQTKFLNIQRKGDSQNDLLFLANEVTQSEYGISIQDCGKSPVAYVYLDDCLYSGNTALYDLKKWLPNAIRCTTLHLIFLAAHTSGVDYLKQKFNSEAQRYGLSVDYKKWYEFHNLPFQPEKFDGLWPTEVLGNQLVDAYIEKVMALSQEKQINPRLFRKVPTQRGIFSSLAARKVVESAFLKAGAYIVSLPKTPKFQMRPLGYEYLESLGFGAVFITYRNIANNCPLALWWGDSSFPQNHPFSKWYPLFLRKANESQNI